MGRENGTEKENMCGEKQSRYIYRALRACLKLLLPKDLGCWDRYNYYCFHRTFKSLHQQFCCASHKQSYSGFPVPGGAVYVTDNSCICIRISSQIVVRLLHIVYHTCNVDLKICILLCHIKKNDTLLVNAATEVRFNTMEVRYHFLNKGQKNVSEIQRVEVL